MYMVLLFQVVGFDKVNRTQCQIDKLRTISLSNMTINDEFVDLLGSLPALREIDLSKNLLSSWHKLAKLVSQVFNANNFLFNSWNFLYAIILIVSRLVFSFRRSFIFDGFFNGIEKLQNKPWHLFFKEMASLLWRNDISPFWLWTYSKII